MNARTRFVTALVLIGAVAAGAFWLGRRGSSPPPANAASAVGDVLYWYDPMYPQQHFSYRGRLAGKRILRGESHPLRDNASRERIAVGVQATALERHQLVTIHHPIGPKYSVFFYITDDEARQVVIRRCIHPG